MVYRDEGKKRILCEFNDNAKKEVGIVQLYKYHNSVACSDK